MQYNIMVFQAKLATLSYFYHPLFHKSLTIQIYVFHKIVSNDQTQVPNICIINLQIISSVGFKLWKLTVISVILFHSNHHIKL